MAIDVTALNTALGAYHRAKSEEIFTKLLTKDYSMKYFRTVAGVKDQWVATEAEFTDMVQGYQKAWTPSGDPVFKAEIINARRLKIDWAFEPAQMEKTFEGARIDGSLIEGQDLLEGYIMDKIIQAVKKQLEYREIFSGVYAAPTPGTPAAAGTNIQGLRAQVAAAITATKITAIATGAITQATARDKFEQVFDAVPVDFQSEELLMICSPELARWYNRDYRAEFGTTNVYEGMKKELTQTALDGTNALITPCPGMAGSQRIIVTTPNNLVRVVDAIGEDNTLNLRFAVNRREIEVMADFKMGVGFPIIQGLVWANDQA